MLKPLGLPRINNILVTSILGVVVLYFGKEFFVMVIFSGLLAMLMAPLSNMLENHRFSRILSSLVSILIIIAIIALTIIILSEQIAGMAQDIPKIKSGLENILTDIQSWISQQFGMSFEDQMSTVKEQASFAVSNAGKFLTGLVKGTLSFFGRAMIVIVFTFLFLLHREKYENFLVMLYKQEKRKDAREVLKRISKVSQQYLSGRLISILFLGILYIAGFIIIGLKNAALVAAITAVMTFVPYIGPVAGGLIPFFLAIIGGSFSDAVWVVVILSAAQVLDNYFIEPVVVGGSVNINPFFAIFILIIGGAVWGISGVILFLPLLGILKIVLENIEGLEPYVYLIGDQREKSAPDEIWSGVKGLFSRKK